MDPRRPAPPIHDNLLNDRPPIVGSTSPWVPAVGGLTFSSQGGQETHWGQASHWYEGTHKYEASRH